MISVEEQYEELKKELDEYLKQFPYKNDSLAFQFVLLKISQLEAGIKNIIKHYYNENAPK